MKVVHLNTSDSGDGVGWAAYRLHRGLRQAGVDSGMFVQRGDLREPEVTAFRYSRRPAGRLQRALRAWQLKRSQQAYRKSRPSGYERFSDDRALHGAAILRKLPPADIYNLHSIADFIDYPAFFGPGGPLSGPAGLVWTLHDMEPFTGGCHYAFDCRRFESGCGACPQLGSQAQHDLSRQVWERKQALFERIPVERLRLVALNRWMAGEVQRSPLLGRFEVEIIPNSLDLEEFAPRPAEAARISLGIPQAARVVLFIASTLQNRRKGFALLAQALHQLQDEPGLFLLSIGSGSPATLAGAPHLHLGALGHPRLLSLVYSAADVLALPSLQDNLPNTLLEALACGTPAAAFAVGGIPDVIQPGETGWLAAPEDTTSLAAAIRQALAEPAQRTSLARNCRKFAEEHFSPPIQAQSYSLLYTRMLLNDHQS